MVLITVRLPRSATMETALRRLALTKEDVDTGYGLVPLDPDKGVFGMRVTPQAAQRLTEGGHDFDGPWSDPRIEPFGPPR
ncbi:hypothetical protein Aph01nite_58790 [Acrocarpospora phusangensis]|uniref:Uncharacterized protein n=1 Tax=Acrocarpospora phusangensis TaxID=1070424 RepID=A0A919QE65_9ACTN|nr:hypothetical protein [Acrocarpospora phusangensis]GIH27569.1 hypothetical protein Aph01nite_58790 [Acrocarpospora phusangensis]